MYGLVNKAIEDLIVSRFGSDTWERVRRRAGVDVEGFISMDPYPDRLTYALVGAAAVELETPAEQLLEAFGEYWTRYTAREGYGELLDMSGRSFEEFLENLDDMHARISLNMPELRPPSFQVERAADGRILLTYVSERVGLAPMIRGLLRGLADRFEVDVDIETLPHDDGAPVVFAVRVLQRQ